MSFRSPAFKFSALISLLWVFLGVAGCASLNAGAQPKSIDSAPWLRKKNDNSRPSWRVTKTMFQRREGFGEYLGLAKLSLQRPVAVAVDSGIFYIVDAGRDELIRFDSISQQGEVIISLSQYAVGEVSDIYLHDNQFLLLTDPQGEQVLQLDLQGNLLRRLKVQGTLRSPIAVTVDLQRNEILVADGAFDQVVVFTLQGQPIATIGERGMDDGQFRSMTALLWSENGLLVAMRPGGRIQLIDDSGVFKKRLQTDGVLFPSAMAMDRYGRLYVSDLMSNDIKIYQNGALFKTLGGAGVALGRFNRITDLWIAQDRLYVVDSLNGRIQSRLIDP